MKDNSSVINNPNVVYFKKPPSVCVNLVLRVDGNSYKSLGDK